jgi:Fe-S-cluster containining protein
MAKAEWPSDPNCPPENAVKSKKWFDRLTSDTEADITMCLQESGGGQAAIRIAKSIQARTEQINRSSFNKLTELRQAGKELPPVACKRGCNYCCHLEVGCLAPEAIRIADHLRKTRSPKELSSLITKMRRHSKFRASLPLRQRSSGNVAPCPFLGQEGECGIYEVRPLNCRTYLTFDAKECERASQNPDRKFCVTFFLEPLDTRDALHTALENACKNLDLPSHQIELIRGVTIALQVPGASTLWRRGVDVFAEANI